MISAWLASKLPIIIAILSIPLAIVAVVQTVRLDGISLFGWHLVDGAIYAEQKAESVRDVALKNLGTCQGNETTLRGSILAQNDAIKDLGVKTTEAEAKANAALEDATAKGQKLAAAEGKILSAKAGADQCKSADALILDSLQ